MIHDNVVISEEIKELYFQCSLKNCKGICCVEGDAGAPLEEEEVGIIEDLLEKVLPLMDDEGSALVQANGVLDFDERGSFVTPLKTNDECVFMIWENDHTVCVFEKAYNSGIIDFKKPVSCHLYPIRIENKGAFDEMNYHRWDICDSALECGKRNKLHVLTLVGEGLIRKYGSEWYYRLINRWNIK